MLAKFIEMEQPMATANLFLIERFFCNRKADTLFYHNKNFRRWNVQKQLLYLSNT